MKKSLIIPLFILFVLPLYAEETLATFPWLQLAKEGRLTVGQIIFKDVQTPFDQLRVDNPNDKLAIVKVFSLPKPQFTKKLYGLTGRVRYERVEGEAYLEMLTDFGDFEEYYSRTDQKTGPMKKLQGTSGWRDFVLPFLNQKKQDPVRVVFNVFFLKHGTVYLADVKLVQYGDREDPFVKKY